MLVRDAEIADLPRLTEIYNQAIIETVATFDLKPFAPEQRRDWFAQFGPSRPIVVCQAEAGEAGGDGEDGAIAGYAYYLPYRPKPAYDRTKELTIYVDSKFHGQGVGSALYTELITRAREQGVHALIGILGGENPSSAALHRKFGFELTGRMPEVGRKFDSWVDTFIYVKIL